MAVATDVIPPSDNVLRDVVFRIRKVIIRVAKGPVCIKTIIFVYQSVRDIFRAGSSSEAEILEVIHWTGKL